MTSPTSTPRTGNWIEFDERSNATDYLEMTAFFLENLPEATKWKWVVISLHQALYAFLICALRGGNWRSVLDKNDRLIGIWEALRRAKDQIYMTPVAGTPLVTTPDEDQAVQLLVSEFRNGFEHFIPVSWVIDARMVSGQILGQVLRIVRFVALQSGPFVFADDGEERRRVENVLDRLDALLAAIK